MNKCFSILFLLLMNLSFAQTLETLHDFTAVKITGDTMNLADLAGKKVMIVNTASFCSYTPQYADLQQLYSLYGGTTFEIIGFPCNDFGSQEPYNDSIINSFCTAYGVTFQMMSKIDIISPDTAEVYKWLQLQSRNGVANAPVTWNFNKFLIDEAGHWINHYTQTVNPLDTAIVNWILSPNTTGINQYSDNYSITFSSNPVKEMVKFNIETNKEINVEVKLFSVNGIFVADVFKGNVNKTTLLSYPANNLMNGLYILKVNCDKETKTFKFAVIK